MTDGGAAPRRACLGLIANWAGSHSASWRHPHVPPGAPMDIDFYRAIAATAERGRFDLIFLADHLATGDPNATPADLEVSGEVVAFEPITLLACLAGSTRHIGLTATISTTYSEPFNVARMMASLDHLSRGRAGWNVVTSERAAATLNFGGERRMKHDDRYARAREYVDVVTALWDSWDDDAFTYGKADGIYFDRDKLHFTNHDGEYFYVRGPLNVARPPQGHPVVIQAGSSDAGQELAAATADLVFTGQLHIDNGRAFYRSVKQRLARYGRDPASLKIMPGLIPIVAPTEAAAKEKYDFIQSLITPEAALASLASLWGGIDFSKLDLDAPADLPFDPDHGVNRQNFLMEMARREALTLRQLAYRATGTRSHRMFVGSAEAMADDIELWLDTDAADGFNIFPAWLPDGLDDFVEMVVPLLQERGRFRTEYEGATLRENLGLKRPANRFARSVQAAGSVGSS
jgi:alkanesulfonate monooxygenase